LRETLTGRFASGLFETGNADALADRLRDFMSWRQREPSLGAACTQHVRDAYTLNQMVDRLEDLLVASA
jgi:hypothetical protein